MSAIFTQYICATCGTVGDEHFKDQSCPQCHSNLWIAEDLRCTCLHISSTWMFQFSLTVTDPRCEVHGYM